MAQGQQQGQADNSLAPIWIVVAIFLLGFVIWYYAKAPIVAFVLKLRLLEMDAIGLFTDRLEHVQQTVASIPYDSYAQIGFYQLVNLSSTVGSYLRYPLAAILVLLGVLLYFTNATTRYKRTYTMQAFFDAEKENWPYVDPVDKKELIKADIDKGPWAMALTPMQFAKKHGILRLQRIIHQEGELTRKSEVIALVDRDETQAVFAMQLGPFWAGVESLPAHMKALYAIFAARAAFNRKESTALLQKIAASALSGSVDYSGADALLGKHKDHKEVVRVTQKHAYVLTVMASLLTLARADGVLASAEFLWLKPVDRVLWLMMSCVGRKTAFPEVAGPFAHWIAECEFGKKLYVPMVGEAVKGLDAAVREIAYSPEETQEM